MSRDKEENQPKENASEELTLLESHERLENLNKLAGLFTIIAVSMFYDPPSQVLNFIKKNDIPFPVVIDADNKIAQRFENIRLTPTSVLINQKGQIIDQIVGEIDFDNLEKLLSKNL